MTADEMTGSGTRCAAAAAWLVLALVKKVPYRRKSCGKRTRAATRPRGCCFPMTAAAVGAVCRACRRGRAGDGSWR